MKQFRVIIVVGRRKSGKSTFVKDEIIGKYPGKKFIYDVNNEYPGGIFMDMEKFHDIAVNLRDHLILYEEATIFFSNKGDVKSIRNMCVRARHTNNIIVFVFHGLQYVPLNILNFSDIVFLKKTNDNFQLIEKKFKHAPRLLTAYRIAKMSDNPFITVPVRLL